MRSGHKAAELVLALSRWLWTTRRNQIATLEFADGGSLRLDAAVAAPPTRC